MFVSWCDNHTNVRFSVSHPSITIPIAHPKDVTAVFVCLSKEYNRHEHGDNVPGHHGLTLLKMEMSDNAASLRQAQDREDLVQS